MTKEWIEIKCIEIEQPIGVFYIGKISWQDLLVISYSEKRRIIDEEMDKAPSYFGIQRELSSKRLKEIAHYVSYSDATFPSSIVLAIPSVNIDTDERNIEFDEDSNILKIRRNERLAHIIDGQHRIFGLEEYKKANPLLEDLLNFELIVSIFVDIDDDNQSMIFATINKAQTKVNKSLVYDLYELAKTKSPQRTAHNIVKLLDEAPESPLYKRVNRLGKANDPLKDRDLLKKGKKLQLADNIELRKRFFRNWFINGEDAKIAKILLNYLSAIKQKWPLAWGTSILTKSTGIIAFMKFLSPAINKLGIEKEISQNEFYSLLENIQIRDGVGNKGDFHTDNYVPGAKG